MAKTLIRLIRSMASKITGDNTFLIKLEGRLNIDEDQALILNKFQQIYGVSNGTNVVLDMSQVKFIYPSALLFLLGLKESLSSKDINLEIRLDLGSPIHQYLIYCGFGQYFELPELPKDVVSTMTAESDVYKLEQIQKIGDTEKKAETLVDMLKIRQPLSPQVEAFTMDSMSEILRNIAQHSEYTSCLILGQAYPKSKRIRFAFYDNGIGIRSHLTRLNYSDCHPFFRELISDELYQQMRQEPANTAIVQAVRYEVSGTNYASNSGAGLDFLRRLTVPTNGTIVIISENGYVKWVKGDKKESISLPFNFKGTLVSATINCNSDSVIAFKREIESKGGTQ